MAFTTLAKKDWRLLLDGSKTCEEALGKFPSYANVETIGNWTKEVYGRNWESDQNIITARLLKLKFCTLPQSHPASEELYFYILELEHHSYHHTIIPTIILLGLKLGIPR